ncbi:MAG: hypothetical protein EXR85_07260 [Xanthomonadales bacterium]|nr:hypothetical protein [Xanthomonadales bacterium]
MHNWVGKIGIAALLPAIATLTSTTLAADDFAPAGARATLSVDYIYESAGALSSEGMYDPYEWRVKRSAKLVAQLVAQAPTALSTTQAPDAEQTAALESLATQAQQVSTDMAPMMASVEAIMEKCGEDEDCITQETMKLGAAMSGTPEMDAAMQAGAAAQELGKPGAPRYQAWRPTAQTGTYNIDETVHISSTDPICMSLPGGRCTRDEVRTGSGDIPIPPDAKNNPDAAVGFSSVELDSSKNTLTVLLPIPLFPLPYTETITTDEPEGTHDTPTPVGPQQQLMSLRVNAKGGATNDQALVVALEGDWHSQSGEQVVTPEGPLREAGKLTIRWNFAVR